MNPESKNRTITKESRGIRTKWGFPVYCNELLHSSQTFIYPIFFHISFQISKEKTSTSGKLSGQSTLSEDESAGHHHTHNGNKEIRFQTSNTSSNDESGATLALNESLSRQSSAQRKDSKFSKSRNPIQCLNPTELQVFYLTKVHVSMLYLV